MENEYALVLHALNCMQFNDWCVNVGRRRSGQTPSLVPADYVDVECVTAANTKALSQEKVPTSPTSPTSIQNENAIAQFDFVRTIALIANAMINNCILERPEMPSARYQLQSVNTSRATSWRAFQL